MKTKYLLIILVIPLLLSSFDYLSAGDKVKIRLLDKNSKVPIAGASYQYGEQKGKSDKNGYIMFDLEKDLQIELSHISYGKWILTGDQILNSIKTGMIYRRQESIFLYPLTVISVRPEREMDDVLDLDYQDKMSHDGGALLIRTPVVSSIRKSGSYGFDPVLRGFKYDQLNIVINGCQCATAACPNRMDPPTSQMAPNMTDRIEVLKGPFALRYGTGVGGTINFIPAKLRFSENFNNYGRLSSGYESNGNIFRSEGMIGFVGADYDLVIFGSWSKGGDYKSGNSTEIPADFNRSSVGTVLGFRITDKQKIKLSALFNKAGDTDFPALPMDLMKDHTWMLNAVHDITFNEGCLKSINTTLFGSFVNHLMDNLLKPLDPRTMNAKTDANTYNYGGRSEGQWIFQNTMLYAGIDLHIEGANGIRTREMVAGPKAGMVVKDNAWQDGEILKTGLFAEYHINSDSFRYILSGRMELNKADASNTSPEFTRVYSTTVKTHLNPALSFGALREINDDGTIGIWIGRAQRSGSLAERFINYFPIGQDPYEILGNPQVKPEINNQMDLTFEWNKGNTTLNLDIFAGYMQDYISSVIDTNLTPRLPNSPGVRQVVNINEAFKTGFEISWSQYLVSGLTHHLGIAYTYGQDLVDDVPLPEIAPLDFRYLLSGRYLDNKLRLDLTVRHVLEQSRISTEFGESATPSFTVVDFMGGYQITEMIRLKAGINNILNENYYEHLNRSVRGNSPIPLFSPGRNFFFSVNLNMD